MIKVEHIQKVYRVRRKAPGLKASLKGLFTRRLEEVRAVDDVTFALEPGERVGFLGPNGAGKTTTLKMLAGLLTPTAGRISIFGLEPRGRPRALLRQLALVMGQKQQLLWDLPPIDTLELNRAVYAIDRTDFTRTLGELTELLGLGGLLDKPTRQLSLGERMKCELAAALIHRPRVLFLDEPTIGLDVNMQATMRRFIREYNEATGATILLTSHYMDDVAALCPRVIVIHAGRLRHDGELASLVRTISPDKRIHIHLAQPVDTEALRVLSVHGEPLRVSAHTDGLLSLAARPEAVTETVRAILEMLPVSDLRVEDPPLEDVMQQVFGGTTR